MNRNNRGNIYYKYLYPNLIVNKILHEWIVTFDYWWKSNFTAEWKNFWNGLKWIEIILNLFTLEEKWFYHRVGIILGNELKWIIGIY